MLSGESNRRVLELGNKQENECNLFSPSENRIYNLSLSLSLSLYLHHILNLIILVLDIIAYNFPGLHKPQTLIIIPEYLSDL